MSDRSDTREFVSVEVSYDPDDGEPRHPWLATITGGGVPTSRVRGSTLHEARARAYTRLADHEWRLHWEERDRGAKGVPDALHDEEPTCNLNRDRK